MAHKPAKLTVVLTVVLLASLWTLLTPKRLALITLTSYDSVSFLTFPRHFTPHLVMTHNYRQYLISETHPGHWRKHAFHSFLPLSDPSIKVPLLFKLPNSLYCYQTTSSSISWDAQVHSLPVSLSCSTSDSFWWYNTSVITLRWGLSLWR